VDSVRRILRPHQTWKPAREPANLVRLPRMKNLMAFRWGNDDPLGIPNDFGWAKSYTSVLT